MPELTQKNIANIIETGESETLEFKSSFNDEALETIGAFANTKGGVVLIGIDDTGKIIGTIKNPRRFC